MPGIILKPRPQVSLILLVLVSVGWPASTCFPQTGHISDAVKSNLISRTERGEAVGTVVGVIDARGRREYFCHGNVSITENTPVDENSVYEIGSISKVFTNAILADMILKRDVDLDDPAELYLPEDVILPTRNDKVITLEHLATHTSGISRMPDNFRPKDVSNPYADYSVDQMYEFLSGYELTRDIGSRFEYSNLGMGLLGHILSLKAGMSYEDLLEERICGVLGMTDTAITLSPDQKGRLAKGHNKAGEVANWDIPTLAGAGAIRSTAHDMLTWLSVNLGLIETELVEAVNMTHEPRAEAGDSMHVGLGWIIRDNGTTQIVWHNGGTGGYRTFCGFVKDRKIGVVVLSNMNISLDDIGFHVLDSSYPLKGKE